MDDGMVMFAFLFFCMAFVGLTGGTLAQVLGGLFCFAIALWVFKAA